MSSEYWTPNGILKTEGSHPSRSLEKKSKGEEGRPVLKITQTVVPDDILNDFEKNLQKKKAALMTRGQVDINMSRIPPNDPAEPPPEGPVNPYKDYKVCSIV